MSDEQTEPQQPDNPGGRVVVTGHAVVYKGGQRKAEQEQDTDKHEEER